MVTEDSPTDPVLIVRREAHRTWIGFNRPEVRNALNEEVVGSIHAVLDEATEPGILIFHSTTPGMFVAGADIAELIERGADDALRAINAGLFERIEAHRWPTIAAVDGWALGGGCELAMACDMRVAGTRARFGQPELSLGILAGAGGNWRLVQLVGLGLARRMLYTGEIIDADTALTAGLVDRVCPSEELEAAAAALADTIAERSWRALELTKLALGRHRPATTGFDVAAQALLFESEDKKRRMNDFLNRRRR